MKNQVATKRSASITPSGFNGQEAMLLPVNPGEDFLTGAEWVTLANDVQLTNREIVVAALLLHGRTRKSIGKHLRLSPETVRVYIDRLFEKLQVRDRLGLALRIARIREAMRRNPS